MAVEARYYQPALLWALVSDWARAQHEATDPHAMPIGQHDLHLRIYLKGKSGCYYLYSPKLYWQDGGEGDHWSNCGQSELQEHAAELTEVILYNVRARRSSVIGRTYEQAIATLTAGA